MRRRGLPVATLVAAGLALAAPTLADGSTYCAGTAGADCNGGVYPATGDGLQAAIDAADAGADISGAPDTVRIGSGRYLRTGGDGFRTIGGDLAIEGAGQSTVLATDGATNRIVLGVTQTTGGATAAAVSSLRIDLAGSANGIIDFRRVTDVLIGGPGSAITGIRMPPGGRLTRAVIEPLTVTGGAVSMSSGVVEDVAVRLRRAGTLAVYGVAVSESAAPVTQTTIRHLTVVGDGTPFTTGVAAQAFGTSGAPRTLEVSLRDTLIRNVDIPLRRLAGTSPSNPGTARIDYRYSSLDLTPGESIETGPGALTAGPGNLDDPDPLLGPDLEPSAGSPLADAGDPAAPEPGDSATDAVGLPRIVGARRDIGALERQTLPSAAVAVGPGPSPPGSALAAISRLRVVPAAFRAAASAPSRAATARQASIRPGAKVVYALDAASKVRFSVRRLLPGRRVGPSRARRCAPATARNAAAARCRRAVALRGAFTRTGAAGTNRFRFSGRLAGTALAPGSYRLIATTIAAAGARGVPVGAGFRILPGASLSRAR